MDSPLPPRREGNYPFSRRLSIRDSALRWLPQLPIHVIWYALR